MRSGLFHMVAHRNVTLVLNRVRRQEEKQKKEQTEYMYLDERGARTEGGKEGWEEIRKVMRIVES
jgi:hypothetical protein